MTRRPKSISEMTPADLVAGRFTINDLIEGLSLRAAVVCLVLGLAVIGGGVALLIAQNLAELLVRVVNVFGPICVALYGLVWTIGSAGALARRLRRPTNAPE